MKIAMLHQLMPHQKYQDFFQIKVGHLVEEFGGFVESKSTMV